MRRLGVLSLAFALAAVSLSNRSASAGSGFERFADRWSQLHDYSVTIDAHEVLGAQTDEHEYWYAFRKPESARLDIVAGSRSGATELWNGGDGIVAYKRAMSFFKKHGHVKDRDLTTLRGNDIMMPNMGDLVACFAAHRDSLQEKAGPEIDGEPTDEILLPYGGVACPDDSDTDRSAVTLDVLDVSRATGLVLIRTRFQGDVPVERFTMKDYKIDSGIDDGTLR